MDKEETRLAREGAEKPRGLGTARNPPAGEATEIGSVSISSDTCQYSVSDRARFVDTDDFREITGLVQQLLAQRSGSGLSERLNAAQALLDPLLAASGSPDANRVDALLVSLRVCDLQQELMDDALARFTEGVSNLQRKFVVLSTMDPELLVQEIPRRISQDLQLDRVMISAVSKGIWVPKRLYINGNVSDQDEFLSFVDGARIPLLDAPMETEIVRRRTAALVPNPDADARTYKDIIDVSQTARYIAAPLVSRGKVLGILHADRAGSNDLVSEVDLEMLKVVAQCASIAYETATLRAKIESSPLWISTASELGRQLESERSKTQSVLPERNASPTRYGQLTPRERQVLSQMATGSTNQQIARALFISDETVKTHTTRIYRKLGVSSRAEAVARFSSVAQTAFSKSRP